MDIRPLAPADLDAVLSLNQGALDAVGPLDADRLAWLVGLADQVLVVDDGHTLAGFAVTVAPGTAYDSPNYRWFCDRYDDFSYLDRVVVAETHRRRGVGRSIYDKAEAASPERMTLEVYAEPPNAASLAFHSSRGFVEVGRRPQDNGKVAAMLVKELGSGPSAAPRP